MNEFLEKDEIISRCENFLREIKDIVSAEVKTDPEGKLSEIRVVSKADKSPKEIVRDIESTLIAFLGAQTDLEKTCVSQIKDERGLLTKAPLKIKGISTCKTQQNLEVKVLLEDSLGRVFEGKAKGAASFKSQVSTTAHATINAIQLCMGNSFVIALDDICNYKIGNIDAISVLVSVLAQGKEEHLLGCALVVNDIYEGASQAVLNAINMCQGGFW